MWEPVTVLLLLGVSVIIISIIIFGFIIFVYFASQTVSSCLASRSVSRESMRRCFSELVPLRSPDSNSSASEPSRPDLALVACLCTRPFAFLPICKSQEQSLNINNQSLILRH